MIRLIKKLCNDLLKDDQGKFEWTKCGAIFVGLQATLFQAWVLYKAPTSFSIIEFGLGMGFIMGLGAGANSLVNYTKAKTQNATQQTLPEGTTQVNV